MNSARCLMARCHAGSGIQSCLLCCLLRIIGKVAAASLAALEGLCINGASASSAGTRPCTRMLIHLLYVSRHLQFLDNEEQRAKITDATLSQERRYMHRHRTIAAHYRFIFHQMFDCFEFPKVIVLEVRWDTLALARPRTELCTLMRKPSNGKAFR